MDDDDTQAAWHQIEQEKSQQEDEAWERHCQSVDELRQLIDKFEREINYFHERVRKWA